MIEIIWKNDVFSYWFD